MPKQRQLLHDPRDFHIPDSTVNELSKEDREEMHTLVFRRWMPFLSGSEFKIVAFIYDRTISYGRRWAYVTIETLVSGYPLREFRHTMHNFRRDPKFYKSLSAKERSVLDNGAVFLTAPTGLGRRQVITSLDTLEKRGFIFRIRNADEPEIALNPDANYSYVEYILDRKG